MLHDLDFVLRLGASAHAFRSRTAEILEFRQMAQSFPDP